MPLLDYATAVALMLMIPTAAFLALAGLLHLSALALARWRRWRERRAIGRDLGGELPAHLVAPEPPHCTCCELRLPEPGGDARLYRRVHEQAQADRQRIAELERELAEARSALPAAWLRARLCLRAKNGWMERALEAERKELEREQRAQPEVGGVHRARWEDLAHALRIAEHDLQRETERADALQQRLDGLDAAYQRACDSLREETELRLEAEAERDEARRELAMVRETLALAQESERLAWERLDVARRGASHSAVFTVGDGAGGLTTFTAADALGQCGVVP